jgi:hypothetical protein
VKTFFSVKDSLKMSAGYRMLLLMSYLLLCLNLSLAFPMWYGHPMVMGSMLYFFFFSFLFAFA